MGSDRARVTYDPKQQYRSVVMQQGRVTLEADWNEASQIASEELRKETLDIVGSSGTPDNGYQILLAPNPSNPPYDFYVQSGTMYVGGMRVHLLENVQYSNQPDWQDYGPPYWVSLSSLPGSPPVTDEFVYLYLREQEVSAVEDPDLKDVALGGPDTAQRTRFLQHLVRVSCDGTTCASGLSAAQTQWQNDGLHFDPATMRLKSWAGLQVSFSSQGQNQGPCQPQAQGGYVDPDNQLIRVQISEIDSLGNPHFIWGFDDASFLYRVNLNSSGNGFVFQSVPVDASHQPVKGQVVELLRTAADLPNGGYVAASSGLVFQLDANYDPTQQSVALPSSVTLPSDYTSSTLSPPSPLFLRVWQDLVINSPGTPSPLGDTGVVVTLTLQSPGAEFHVGDFWLFAVRPATPQNVYPERYLSAPQPPDGPRLWACPLGVISWNDEVGTLAADCRRKFGRLAHRALHVTGINWPNDDLVSLAAFRKNSLQVSFDFSPGALSVSNSSLVVTVEVPYLPPRIEDNRDEAVASNQTVQANKAVQGRTAVQTAKAVQAPATVPKTKKAQSAKAVKSASATVNFVSGSTRVAGSSAPTTASAAVGKVAQTTQTAIRNPIVDPISIPLRYHLPAEILDTIGTVVKQQPPPVSQTINPDVVGYLSMIQPGQISTTSNLTTWTRQLVASLTPYLSLAAGPLRVRVTINGRDVWSVASPIVHLDGQVFGQQGERVDGVTPCTNLVFPSGDNQRASDFESWFWLAFLVWDRTDYPVGASALCLATADFNGDGNPDLAVCTSAGTVLILLNNGDGTFTAGNSYPTGANPVAIVAGEFRTKGMFDLAVVNNGDASVTILLGYGDGTFSVVPNTIAVGNGPSAIVTADFNNDGYADLAVTNSSDGTVSILLNNKDGQPTFTATTVKVGNTPMGMAAADFKNAGNIDLAVVNTADSTVSILFNDGKGDLAPDANLQVLQLPTSSLPFYIVAADFNKDSYIDLAIGCWDYSGSGPSIAVCFNEGSLSPGSFFVDDIYDVPGLPGPVVAADFDGDGNLDLIATSSAFLFSASNTIFVLPGNGDGTFESALTYPVGNDPDDLVVADFNGDGLPDVAVTNYSDGTVSVLINEQDQITSNIIITQVVPAGAVHPGDQIELIGRGFGVPDLNSITIAGVPVTIINTGLSSNTALTFTVPSIQGIPTQGQTSTLYISNPNGSTTWRLLLMQSQGSVPTGQLAVAESQVSPKTAVATGNILVTFSVSGNTTLADNYNVAATVDAGWTAVLVNPSNNQPIVPSQINIPAANYPQMVNTSFVIMVTVPAGLSVGSTGNLNVTVTSQLNPQQLNATTPQPYVLTVGSIPGGSQNAVIISLSSIQAPGSSPDGKTLIIPLNANPAVVAIFNFQVNQADSYAVAASGGITFANPAGWTATVQSGGAFSGPPNPQPMYVQLVAAQGATTTTMTIQVVGTNTGAVGQAIFTVQTK